MNPDPCIPYLHIEETYLCTISLFLSACSTMARGEGSCGEEKKAPLSGLGRLLYWGMNFLFPCFFFFFFPAGHTEKMQRWLEYKMRIYDKREDDVLIRLRDLKITIFFFSFFCTGNKTLKRSQGGGGGMFSHNSLTWLCAECMHACKLWVLILWYR